MFLNKPDLKPSQSQVISFTAIGACAGILDYSIMVLVHETLALDPVVSALIGYVAGSIASYILNKIKTFKSSRRHVEALWRFAAISALGFIFTGILMRLFVDNLRIQYMLARIIVVGLIAVFNFTCYKYWAFAHRS